MNPAPYLKPGWALVALTAFLLLLGLFPDLLFGLTSLLGVVLPANLLFAMAILLLLGVALHLSWEQSRAEDEIRRAAEELAILRADHDLLAARVRELQSENPSSGPGREHPSAGREDS